MVLKKIGGKSFLVNLLSDFILSKIPKETDSIIVVVDCENFVVVKGKTNSKDVLDLSSVITEFSEKYKSYLSGRNLTHTIDLIEYDIKLESKSEISQTYYNSEFNCSYPSGFNDELDESELVYMSSFPHGYSLSQGRLLFYYGKKIFYNIPTNYPVSALTFTISTKKDEDGEQSFKVFDEFHKSEDHILKSAILDVFNFDMSKLEKEIKKVDWSLELTNPLEEYTFLKEKVGELIII